MARKSLIEAGSLLPPREADESDDDVMSRVLSRDREKNGRRPPEPDNITKLQNAHITAHTRSNDEISAGGHLTALDDEHTPAPQSTHISAHQSGQQRSRADVRAGARKLAQKMAASPPIPITLRLPEDLNDFLDEAAHARRKQGVKKQDLVSRAVQLLVVALAEEEEGE